MNVAGQFKSDAYVVHMYIYIFSVGENYPLSKRKSYFYFVKGDYRGFALQ